MAPMPTARGDLSAGAIDGVLYVAGGFNGAPLGTLEAYDPSTNTWSEKAPMPTPRALAAAAVVDHILYVIGGLASRSSSIEAVNTVEAYDPSTNSWKTKAHLLSPRARLCAQAINGIIYAIGGNDNRGDTLKKVEAYDPRTNTWVEKAPMPQSRESFGAGSIDGILYVLGGSGPDGEDALSYDASTDRWSVRGPMEPDTYYDLAAAVYREHIYTFGGVSFGDGHGHKFQAYTPASDMWSAREPMPTGRWNLAAAQIKGVLYAAGGFSMRSGEPVSSLEAYRPR